MSRLRPPGSFFDRNTDPVERRIATGLHKIGLAMKHETWQRATADGVSPTQGQILAALAQEGPLTATEVAERLGVTLPTVSDAVKALVAKGLVARSPDRRHARALLLSLTPAAGELAARARSWPELLAGAVGAMSDDERAVFLSGLIKMMRSLQEERRIPLQRMCITCVHFRPDAHRNASRPHHCAFVDAPLAAIQLRIDCAEHEPAVSGSQGA